MSTATFTFIRIGRPVILRPEWQKIMGFTKGRIIRLITSWERTAVDGGTYTIQRLDGPSDLMDITHDLHRLTFVPTSPEMLERLNRREAKNVNHVAKRKN